MASIKRIGKDKFGCPVWEAVYRRSPGDKQIRRRFHTHSKAEVERAILLDSRKSGIGLKWSEGVRIYLEAKRADGMTERSAENIERAGKVFVNLMGDMAIEDTEPEIFKAFMQSVTKQPVKHFRSGKVLRKSGPKVANHHRKELLAVARYLLSHTDKIKTIPFERVPPLPAKYSIREPVPTGKVNLYLDALNPHVRRPVLMVLYYGLRSTAVCNLTESSIDRNELLAMDKFGLKWRIPIDPFLAGVLVEARQFKESFASRKNPITVAENLFVNARGKPWTRGTLLRAAQNAWENAGLERKMIHEIRHTLGTLAGKLFPKGMVQAAMRHTSEKSSARYFHPNEEMAAEVREKIITNLSQEMPKTGENARNGGPGKGGAGEAIQCPFIMHIFNQNKK